MNSTFPVEMGLVFFAARLTYTEAMYPDRLRRRASLCDSVLGEAMSGSGYVEAWRSCQHSECRFNRVSCSVYGVNTTNLQILACSRANIYTCLVIPVS